MASKPQLNNVEAYRFISLHMVPVLMKHFDSEKIKYVKPTAKSEIADINFKIKLNGGTVTTTPTLFYTGSDSIALSLHKMMYAKNILTIVNGVIYIISSDKLLSVWSNKDIVRIENRTYTDGLGERAQLSRVKISWLIENADYSFTLSSELASRYEELLKMVTK